MNADLPDPASIQRFTEEVLRGREFHQAAPPRSGEWLRRLLEWLGSHIIFGNVSVGTFLWWTFVGGLAAFLAFHIVRLLLREPAGRTAHAPRMQRAGGVSPAAFIPTDGILRAQGALAQGDLRGAVEHLYHTCITLLSAAGLITVQRWKTNTAYLRECPASAAAYPVFRDLTDAYERIVYAHQQYARQRIEQLFFSVQGLCGEAG